MKMYGSNLRDTLIGTAKSDTIKALGGNDLIATAGGVDTILAGDGNDMITGFSFKLSSKSTSGAVDPDDPSIIMSGASARSSAQKKITVDGGDGEHDVMLIEMTAAKGVSEVDTFKTAIKVRNVEEFIYNFGNVTADQKILGSNSKNGIETIVVAGGNANVDLRGGDDAIFTGAGDDIIKAGGGSDFIHAGEGHNTVSSGSGIDHFHFHLTGTYQYTNITDFEGGVDKIVISIDFDQVNLIRGTSHDAPLPVRWYGDGYLGVGSPLNAYVSYNHGREFDADDFTRIDPDLAFDDWALYEQSTGSIFVIHYEEHSWGLETEVVLVAHVEPGTVIDESDFSFRMI
ncbi:MAG: hypothetical protein KL863_09485 [Rhizobium sp.]|nr:hypothetical protein [Rhizobium sp.]